MSEKFLPSSDERPPKSEGGKQCFEFSMRGQDHYRAKPEWQEGEICFDSDKKIQSLSELLKSSEEKQCLDYQINSKNKIRAALEKRSGKLCMKKKSNEGD